MKHDLIREYLREYFRILTNVPKRTQLRLTLFDGFAGGGSFTDDKGGVVEGTPLILGNEVARAHTLTSASRDIDFEIDFWINELDAQNFESLKYQIENSGFYQYFPGRIHLRNLDYSFALAEALQNMERIKGTTGRSIFLFDQTGFSQVNLEHIRTIFARFKNPEVILTFSVSWLVDLAKNDPTYIKKVAPLGIREEELTELLEAKDAWAPRYAGQRWIREYIRQFIGAEFDTCFFLKSRPAGKDIWLLHFAKNWRARDAMMDVHYRFANETHFYGKAGFEMLGFDPKANPDQARLFEFTGYDFELSVSSLLQDLPKSLRDRGGAQGIPMIDLFQREASNATVTNAMFQKGLTVARDEGLVEIRTREGQVRPHARWLNKDDIVMLPNQTSFWHFLA